MGLGLIYKEIILIILKGAGESFPAPYFVFFALAAGLFIDVLCILAGKKWFIPELVMSILFGLYFALQSVLKSVFTMYFSITDMIAASRNVATQYSGEVKNGFIFGTGYFLIFMLPLIVIVILKLIFKKNQKVKDKIENCKVISRLRAFTVERAFKQRALVCVCGVAAAIMIHIIGSWVVRSGPNAALYDGQYNFNNAAETFGLTESTLLSFVRNTDAGDGDFVIADDVSAAFENETVDFSSDMYFQDEMQTKEELTAPVMPSESYDDGDVDGNVAGQSDGSAGGEASGGAGGGASGSSAAVSKGSASEPVKDVKPEEKAYGYNVMNITFPGEEVSSSAANLSKYIVSTKPTHKNKYTGLFEGKNLIMICAESYCDTFITPELTPTLWRLSHNGFYFPNFYQPSWGGSTTTGELSMLLGLDSNMGNESMQKIADNNHYFSMGNQLQRQGYFSTCFHNGSNTFYRRDLTHENLGYDSFFASGQHLDYFTGHGYPSDSEMLEGTLPFYIDKSPFSVYYMTVSGHAPYNSSNSLVGENKARVDEALGDKYYDKTKNYIAMQMDLEDGLTILVDQLEKAGIADDTVIVLTSDHYPYGLGSGAGWGNDMNYINDLVKGKASIPWDADQTGCIIWSGCLEHENKDMACTIDTPTVSLDILPTISNLFGVEFDSRLLPGRDVFSEAEPLVYWNNLSWMTDKARYNNNTHEFTLEDGVEMTEEEQEAYIKYISTQVNNKIKMSSSIMNLDYYGIIFGKDTPEVRTGDVWAQIKEDIWKN